MLHEAFWLNSSDATPLYVNRWFAEQPPKAVVMVAHGMAEHSGRYARLGAALVAAGYELYAHDQRGHGQTASRGILGAYLVGVEMKGLDSAAFWVPIQTTVDSVDDVGGGILKSFVFGIAASMIAVYEGYHAYPTAEGVSRATTRTVIVTALTVLVLDFMLTAWLIQGN